MMSKYDSIIPYLFNNASDPFLRATVGEILFDGVFINCTSTDMTVGEFRKLKKVYNTIINLKKKPLNIRPQFIHNCEAKKSKITHEIIESSKQHTVILKGVNFLLIAGLLCKGMKSRLPPTMRVSDDDDGYYYSMFHHVSALCSKRFFANT